MYAVTMIIKIYMTKYHHLIILKPSGSWFILTPLVSISLRFFCYWGGGGGMSCSSPPNNNNKRTAEKSAPVSNTTVYGGNEYGISGHLDSFTFLKHLIMLLKCNFFRASFLLPITDTDSMQGHAAQIFFFKCKHC